MEEVVLMVVEVGGVEEVVSGHNVVKWWDEI